MTNKDMVRMHLERFLVETEQRGNLNLWGLLGYCVGYYGAIDADTLDVVRELLQEGWVIE